MKTMKNEDSELLMSESVRLTQELRALQGEMARCGKERRDIWQELNDRGVSQRRLSLARAFALRPEVLIMDEPFVSLDPATAGAMHALFEALRADCPAATLLVTHDMAEARRLADRILRMEGAPGRIVAD